MHVLCSEDLDLHELTYWMAIAQGLVPTTVDCKFRAKTSTLRLPGLYLDDVAMCGHVKFRIVFNI